MGAHKSISCSNIYSKKNENLVFASKEKVSYTYTREFNNAIYFYMEENIYTGLGSDL